ncbi:uncharacterized protein MONOS_11241 [Monocercomonoides exilis]|uniref:uncharacterized protein n=1 Tax=Monocercomonoides exilis TaxID=2049356 RepID=UPI00355A4C39|nr:hypothetical protein MONOS_11241 [Monocercomonoides exilis]|eukprot:MONOS_11241.1-p1 / transcript=MONOS_11241.1 / gene=MONOS_11241 / organism=Monocercomonoides_exilis_PA203 / gene_product=unspecified product / transcript_product=unspecified product / location=Mono_scaffold00553:24663-25532(-) / protein_length=290 / sequence_SO=supercontig / SO=protein_coding / is_pseudo=false
MAATSSFRQFSQAFHARPIGRMLYDIVNYLDENRGEISFQDIKRILDIDIEGNKDLLESLSDNVKINFILHDKKLSYKPMFAAKTLEDIHFIVQTHPDGLYLSDVADSCKDAWKHIAELVHHQYLFAIVSRDSIENPLPVFPSLPPASPSGSFTPLNLLRIPVEDKFQMKTSSQFVPPTLGLTQKSSYIETSSVILFPNELRIDFTIPDDIKELWKQSHPSSFSDLISTLGKQGITSLSDPTKRTISKQTGKKGKKGSTKARSKRFPKITNVHLIPDPALFFSGKLTSF